MELCEIGSTYEANTKRTRHNCDLVNFTYVNINSISFICVLPVFPVFPLIFPTSPHPCHLEACMPCQVVKLWKDVRGTSWHGTPLPRWMQCFGLSLSISECIERKTVCWCDLTAPRSSAKELPMDRRWYWSANDWALTGSGFT